MRRQVLSRNSRGWLVGVVAMSIAHAFALGARAQDFGLDDESEVVEATSLLGQPLHRPPLATEVRERLDAELAEAELRYQADPTNLDNIIWYGRRLAYRGRFREAVFVYTQGLYDHPDNPQLLRHRGHRLITLRRLDDAVTDLRRAADVVQGQPDEIEPDGIPNVADRPISTLQTNIYYHLALAHYLRREWNQALLAWQRCVELSDTPEMRVAAGYWITLTLRRIGRHEDARRIAESFDPQQSLIENQAYQQLLAVFAGHALPQQVIQDARRSGDPQVFATQAYGIATWWMLDGTQQQATNIYEEIVRRRFWPAFGYIAAEAELAHRRGESDAFDQP